MEQMVVISVKIPKGLKDKIKKSKLNVSGEVRAMLEKKVLDGEIRKLKEDIKKHKKIFDKISVEDVVRQIREDRDSR